MTKSALLIGINYRGSRATLNGCINDVHVMKKYLTEHRGYKQENIVILTEDEALQPTRANITKGLKDLIGSGSEEVWFHYSGHGSYTTDRDGDEDDGRDETLVPLDYQSAGMITDDELHDHLAKLPEDTKMYCIMDCCHSGTILDLKYQYINDTKQSVENPEPRLKGNIIMISGCKDVQTSADAHIKGKWCGAMTTSYVNCIKDGIECEQLLGAMRDYLKKNHYTQIPQICSSFKITDGQPY